VQNDIKTGVYPVPGSSENLFDSFVSGGGKDKHKFSQSNPAAAKRARDRDYAGCIKGPMENIMESSFRSL
jgi:hypothetical protein